MFEDRTYETILEEVLATAPDGIDTRQGSIYYDAVSGVCLQIARYYSDISVALDLVFLATSSGEYLDRKGDEYALIRNPATLALYELIFEGTQPNVGDRFFTNGLYFVLIEVEDELMLQAEDKGEIANNILTGTAAVPVNNISGLTSSSFGALVEPGSDIESDDDFRQRIREKIAGPAENGNRQHYKTWCEQITGVGRAHIMSLWNGENTVKGVLIGTDGNPATGAIVDRVQEYIDPGGTGLGNGVANIGAHFTAVAAESLTVDVSFNAVLSVSSTLEQALSEAKATINLYIKNLALNSLDEENTVIRLSAIGNILFSLESIVDYSSLTLNGTSNNIEINEEQVAVLGEVEIYV